MGTTEAPCRKVLDLFQSIEGATDDVIQKPSGDIVAAYTYFVLRLSNAGDGVRVTISPTTRPLVCVQEFARFIELFNRDEADAWGATLRWAEETRRLEAVAELGRADLTRSSLQAKIQRICHLGFFLNGCTLLIEFGLCSAERAQLEMKPRDPHGFLATLEESVVREPFTGIQFPNSDRFEGARVPELYPIDGALLRGYQGEHGAITMYLYFVERDGSPLTDTERLARHFLQQKQEIIDHWETEHELTVTSENSHQQKIGQEKSPFCFASWTLSRESGEKLYSTLSLTLSDGHYFKIRHTSAEAPTEEGGRRVAALVQLANDPYALSGGWQHVAARDIAPLKDETFVNELKLRCTAIRNDDREKAGIVAAYAAAISGDVDGFIKAWHELSPTSEPEITALLAASAAAFLDERAVAAVAKRVDFRTAIGLGAEPYLVKATRRQNLPAIRKLLALGAPPDLADGIGRTALHWAALLPDPHALELLVAAGAGVTIRDERGADALTMAVVSDRLDNAKMLLKAGADATATDITGAAPLVHAVARGNAAMCRLLLAHGADATDKRLPSLVELRDMGLDAVADVLAKPAPKRRVA